MKILNINNISKPNSEKLTNVFYANSLKSKVFGLIPYKSLTSSEAMVFKNCGSAHSMFMKFPIDLVFINEEIKIMYIQQLKPWRISKLHSPMLTLIELQHNFCKKNNWAIGDQLEIKYD